MSFSLDVKKEIASYQLEPNVAKAQLAAMIQASLKEQPKLEPSFKVSFSQIFLAKRYVQLIKQLYDVDCEIDYDGKQNFTKTSLTTITIASKIKMILEDVGLYREGQYQNKIMLSRIMSEEEKRAYVSGWFMIKGSLNDPSTSNYHLEFRFRDKEMAEFIQGLMKPFSIHLKLTKRRHEIVGYLKASDQISDVLRLVGAHQGLLVFEDVRIHRDFHNSLTRLDNCEVSNEMKSMEAGNKQVGYINKLIANRRLDHMENRLQEVAHLRLKYPEHSLRELAEEYLLEYGQSISKSGIKHRLDKLEDAANRIKE